MLTGCSRDFSIVPWQLCFSKSDPEKPSSDKRCYKQPLLMHAVGSPFTLVALGSERPGSRCMHMYPHACIQFHGHVYT